MAKEKKEEIKLDETNVDLTKPLEEQVEEKVNVETDEEVPVGFVPPIPVVEETKETLKVRNGRVYKELKNGIGIFADTGETFKI